MPDTENGRATLAGLQAEVHGLARTVGDIAGRFEAFAREIYAKLNTGPNIAAWLAGAALVVSIGTAGVGGSWVLMSQQISNVKEQIERDRKHSDFNDKELRTDLKETATLRREEFRRIRQEAREERALMIAEFKDVRASIVPRGEHEQRWAAQTAATLTLDRRLEETRKTVSDIYSPQDAFKELQRQINELRQLIISGPAKPVP